MLPIITVGALLAILGMSGLRGWNRNRGDDRSIAAHRSTLDVIEHVAGSEHAPHSPHVRVTQRRPSPAPSREPVLPRRPPARRTPGRASFPAAVRYEAAPSVTDPEARPDGLVPARMDAAMVRRLIEEGRDRRCPSRPRLGRRYQVVSASTGALLVAALAGLVVLTHRTTPAPAAESHRAAPIPAGIHRVSGPSGTGRPSGIGFAPAVQRATVPPAIVATASGPDAGAYVVHAPVLDIVITASSPCWTEVREQTVVFEGMLAAGISRAFSATQEVWLRFGYPSGVTVTVDGAPVTLPAGSNPFDLTLSTPS